MIATDFTGFTNAIRYPHDARRIIATETLARPKGRNQSQKSKCKMQNFGFPASRDNSFLSKYLCQPCRKTRIKNKKLNDCSIEKKSTSLDGITEPVLSKAERMDWILNFDVRYSVFNIQARFSS